MDEISKNMRILLINNLAIFIQKMYIPFTKLPETAVGYYFIEIAKNDLMYENGIKHSDFEEEERIRYIEEKRFIYEKYLTDVLEEMVKPLSSEWGTKIEFYQEIIGNLDHSISLAKMKGDYKSLSDITMKKESLYDKLEKIKESMNNERKSNIEIARKQGFFENVDIFISKIRGNK